MKKILLLFFVLLGITSNAYATPITEAQAVKNLMALGMPAALATQVADIAAGGVKPTDDLLPAADNTYDLGSASLSWKSLYADTSVITPLISATGDLILRTDADADRIFTLAASADTAISGLFGTTASAATTINFGVNSTDAADSNIFKIQAAGSAAESRGSYTDWYGNEATVTGSILNQLGNVSGAVFYILGSHANSFIQSQVPLRFNDSGDTIALQEATAGAACMGTLTANGATPVVTATTCAKTGARIFLTRTSAETGVVMPWISAITNNTSFEITGEAGDTGTLNWIIFHETP